MAKIVNLFLIVLLLVSCTSLNTQERITMRSLKANGISVEHPLGYWDKPANPTTAGLMNILPGCGNFYLASGNGGQSEHYLYGFLNLLTWPLSILWGIPEATSDAIRINEKELVYYYTFDNVGQQTLKDNNLALDNRGYIVKIDSNNK